MAFLIFKEFSPLLSSGFPPRPPIPFVTSCIVTLFSLLSSHPSSFSGSFLQARSPTSSLPQVEMMPRGLARVCKSWSRAPTSLSYPRDPSCQGSQISFSDGMRRRKTYKPRIQCLGHTLPPHLPTAT